MKKKELIKKIILSYTSNLDKELEHQEKILSDGDTNQEIINSAYHVIGYITATKYYQEIFLSLITKNKKELKEWIKRDKKILKNNKKSLSKLFKKIKK